MSKGAYPILFFFLGLFSGTLNMIIKGFWGWVVLFITLIIYAILYSSYAKNMPEEIPKYEGER